MSSMAVLLATFLVIFLAELGDKTQLLTLGFAAKYPLWEVLSAVTAATALLMALAVLLGGLLNLYIPLFYIQLFAALFFLYYGVKTLITDGEGEGEEKKKAKEKGKSFGVIFLAFFLAEMGDKTQLATFTLTAKYGSPLLIWLGATLGMVGANLIGALAGRWLQRCFSEQTIKWVGGLVFILFGLWTLGEIFIW